MTDQLADLNDITVAIVARNAAGTIGRAVRSALDAGACSILLVDDGSEDGTGAAAKTVAGDALAVVRNEQPVSVGHARSLALRHIKTPYGLWLDADDELSPGYIQAMREPLATGRADLVFSGCTLVDGLSGQAIKQTDVPDFMQHAGACWRVFERNWYPALTAAFDVSLARSVDYDPAFACAEDYDFLLRAIASGAGIRTISGNGYRYYHYDKTISRDRTKTADFTARALAKHASDDVQDRLQAAGFSTADAACILASKAMFERDYDAALAYATRAASAEDMVMPYGAPARHISAFFAGTAAAKCGYFKDALNILEPLGTYLERPEVYNNVAVCFAECGDPSAASLSLQMALALMPGYVDALANLAALQAGETPQAITNHPIRQAPSRDGYSS